MKKSFFAKIALAGVAIIALLSSALFFISVQTFQEHYRNVLIEVLRKQAELLMPQILPLMAPHRAGELDALVKKAGATIQTRITIIDSHGTVLADSEKDPKTMENHRTRPEIMQALGGEIGTSIRHSATVAEDMLYVALPTRQDGTVTGVVRMSVFMHDIKALIAGFRKGMIRVGVFASVVAIALAFILSRKVTTPVRMLSEASQAIGAGNYDVHVFLDSNDELQECAESFNVMAEKIKAQFDEIVLRREELENIIAAMHEYLLVLDSEGRIVLSNKSFTTVIGSQKVQGHFYWEFIREPEFGDMVRAVRGDKQARIQELQLNGKVLLCSMAWIEQQDEIIAVCSDITEIKNVERMKKDFIVNVSHELRTPLTAIKGFIDTMLDEEHEEQHQRYLAIIKRHTERLISIVRDLLTLARLEEEQHLEREQVYLSELIEQVHKMYEQKLAEKKLYFEVAIDGAAPPIVADRFKIEQLFINLIDNAVKYTEQGGITIRIHTEGEAVCITVQDTGIGIPEQHIPRIFERFYVVDKARSRQAGGTGLGLSIVKHIVMQHQGTIEVKSAVGSGTSFIIRLPCTA